MVETDFHQLTTRSIAAAAGIPESTLFRYFSSKNMILKGFYEQAVTAYGDMSKESPKQKSYLRCLKDRYENLLQVLMRTPGLGPALMREYLFEVQSVVPVAEFRVRFRAETVDLLEGIVRQEGWKLRVDSKEAGALLDSGLIHFCDTAAFYGWRSRTQVVGQLPGYYRGWVDMILKLIFEIPA